MASLQAVTRCGRPANAVALSTPAVLRSCPVQSRTPALLSRTPALPAQRRQSTQTAAAVPAFVPAEVAQLAGEGGFIFGTSAIVFAMTLVGLAVGFVLLRVEGLVEEGKIPVE